MMVFRSTGAIMAKKFEPAPIEDPKIATDAEAAS
jgi:hypothetical protein